MKKLTILSLAAVLCAGLFAPAASAYHGRDGVCTIDVTGPASENRCLVTDAITVICENDNEVTINNQTDQDGGSGDSLVSDNTEGDNADTGHVINENDTVISVAIENNCVAEDEDKKDEKPPVKDDEKQECPGDKNDKDKEDNVCPAAPAAPKGVPDQDVTNLPDTAGTSPAVYAGIAALSLGAAALATRFGLAAYARFKA